MVKISKKLVFLGSAAVLGIVITAFVLISEQTPSSSPSEAAAYTVFAPDVVPGKIITLKKLREEHFIDWHNMFSAKVREPFESPKHITRVYSIRVLRYIMRLCDKGETLYYVIFDNKDNKLIGAIEIREKNNDDPGQLGCWVNENYWGGGRIQEAFQLITEAYFKLKPHEQKYEAQCRVWNKRSYKALKKFGFTEVAIYPDKDGGAARNVFEYYRKDLKK